MAEFLAEKLNKETEKNFYTYKAVLSGLKFKYPTYTSIGDNIMYIKNDETNYREMENYFGKIAKRFFCIELDKVKVGGMPVIRNTRIPVSLILSCLKDDMSIQEICEEYGLQRRDVEEAVEYAVRILDTPYQEEVE